MIALLTKLLTLINALVGAANAVKRDREQKEAQHEVDDAAHDSVGWFGKHFNGVRGGAAVPRDAGNADQAAADKPDAQP